MIDTHCHIHDDEYPLDGDKSYQDALSEGVEALICVGTDAKYSRQAIDFAQSHDRAWASIGLHPHDAQRRQDMPLVAGLAAEDRVVAVGECGLDLYYENSPKDVQQAVLREHFEIAKKNNLPMIFHIRGKSSDSYDAYDAFWQIYDEYQLPGVVHSFSAHTEQLDQILERGLYVGVNGIATFMKDGPQATAIEKIPLERLLVETDAPLLTPVPYRGKINEPKYISTIISFLEKLRDDKNGDIRKRTSVNAKNLFGI